jgi:hypothetical protein
VESVLIKRQGSYFYTRAYWHVVVVLTLVYGGMGAVLALLTDPDLEGVLDRIIFPILAFVPLLMMWLVYTAMLWAFRREGETRAVELSVEGIRETYRGRERVFIPWDGVCEIELNADLIGGANVRTKGKFSAISVSNVDLVLTRPMGIVEVHRALGRADPILKFFSNLRDAAPNADVRMNKLAKRRLKKYALVDGR